VAGTGPGLACAGLYAIGASWLSGLEHAFTVEDARTLARLMLITLVAALVALVGGRLRGALRRERALREEAEREASARRRAEGGLRQAHERLSALQGLTAALSAARTSHEVSAAIFAQALPLVGARAGSISFQEGDRLALRFSEAFADDARRDYAEVPMDAPLPTTEAARSGRGIWLGTAAEIERRYPHLAPSQARWGDRAWACLPLRIEGEPPGVLGLTFREERTFDAFERAYIASVAQLCADALARARRYEAEQEARARAEAAEEAARRAVALQDQVLAVVGHDLRTPLSAVTMAVGLARRLARDERASAALDRIARSARRMNDIIRDLLDAARARQGIGMAVSRVEASAEEVCAQAVSELSQIHPERRIRFSARGDLRLSADPSRLLQAVSNLVGNALQHGAEDSDVSVEAAGDADAVVIRVTNRGAPIPDALMPRIFEPFRRGGDGAAAEGSLGLGLFIVREIARAHGGSVSVSSDDAAGTTFELRVPRAGDGAAHAPAS
jgi:signal transduction histidine kinase